ncbi:hypothetical protein JCM1840_005221 [Sporobolomyces johnsonii]
MTADSTHHESSLDKLKHFFKPEPTEDPDEVHEEIHRARDAHVKAEAQADALIQQRESSELEHPSESGPPNVVPPPHELSSFAHRPSLEEAAEGKAPPAQTTPDLDGVTHIPESELPIRHERMHHTGLRPGGFDEWSSKNDPPNDTALGFDPPAHRPVRLPRAHDRLEIAFARRGGGLRRNLALVTVVLVLVLAVASFASLVFALYSIGAQHAHLAVVLALVLGLVLFDDIVARGLARLYKLIYNIVGIEYIVSRVESGVEWEGGELVTAEGRAGRGGPGREVKRDEPL